MAMTREEHLAWTKQRALEYCETGDVIDAFASLVSDLDKHSETQGHKAAELGTLMMISGLLSTPEAMRKFIEGIQ